MFFVTYRKISDTPTVIRDTTRVITYVIKDTTIYNTTPVLVAGGRDTILEKTIEYIPSDNYNDLAVQFTKLKQELLSRNVFRDSARFDSSSVAIVDTIQQNKIIGRSIDFKMKYPVITNTITITKTNPPKTKFYLGGELGGNKTNLINQFEGAFLLKSKAERIYKAGVQIDINGELSYKGGLYLPLNK